MFSSIVARFGTICGELFLNVLFNLARKTRNFRLFWQEIFAFDFDARKKNTLSRPVYYTHSPLQTVFSTRRKLAVPPVRKVRGRMTRNRCIFLSKMFYYTVPFLLCCCPASFSFIHNWLCFLVSETRALIVSFVTTQPMIDTCEI